MTSEFKPSWDGAPKEAQYLAMDENRTWHFFSHVPTCGNGSWYATGPSGRRWAFYAGSTSVELPDNYAKTPWNESLESRPVSEK